MRPPGHSGKAKKGHLCLDASFETGNLGRIDYVSEFEYDLYIRSDSCNPRHRFWFNFTIDNVRLDQVCNILLPYSQSIIFSDHLGLYPLIELFSESHFEHNKFFSRINLTKCWSNPTDQIHHTTSMVLYYRNTDGETPIITRILFINQGKNADNSSLLSSISSPRRSLRFKSCNQL